MDFVNKTSCNTQWESKNTQAITGKRNENYEMLTRANIIFLKCLPLAKEKFHTVRCHPTTLQKSTWCLMIVEPHQKVRIPNVELVLDFS
jgi:hypothetical protein